MPPESKPSLETILHDPTSQWRAMTVGSPFQQDGFTHYFGNVCWCHPEYTYSPGGVDDWGQATGPSYYWKHNSDTRN